MRNVVPRAPISRRTDGSTDMSRTVWSSVMISTTFGFAGAARAMSSPDDTAIVRAAAAAMAIAPRAPTMRVITVPDTFRPSKLRFRRTCPR